MKCYIIIIRYFSFPNQATRLIYVKKKKKSQQNEKLVL